jgi:CBS domain-containing protein
MPTIPPVANVMTPAPRTVAAEESVETAAAMMKQHGFRHFPVMRDGKLAGILSQRDVYLATEVFDQPGDRMDKVVWTICSREAYTVQANAPIDEVADHMANAHLGSALVMRNDMLVGIVTTSDICRAYAALLREQGVG